MACAAAAALCLMTSAPSQAAAFQVEFDPEPELYGFANFFLAEPCLANDGNFNTVSELLHLALDGCYIQLTSARVSITGSGGPYVDYVAEFPLVLVSALLIVDHELAGLTTLIPIRLEEPNNLELLAASSLQFNFVRECHTSLSFTAPSNSNPDGTASFQYCGPNGERLALTGDVVDITRIPEPGTLGLLFGAGLAGLWVARRRRNAA